MPGHLRICAMSEATCSRPSPPLPQLPIFSTFLRGGLHFGCRTTSSCDLTATRWGNCTTRGSDTPATRCTTASCSATPHHFRWGGRRIAYKTGRNVGCREKVRPARGFQWLIREKTRPARHPQRHLREKTRPARAKTPNLGCFEHAGRSFSRFRAETAPQGELFRARHGNYSKTKRSRP